MLTFWSCGQGMTAARRLGVSVRMSNNTAYFAAGPFTCVQCVPARAGGREAVCRLRSMAV